MGFVALLALAVLLAGCGPDLPREWREALHGPDATPTPRLHNVPTSAPRPTVSVPTPPPPPTPLPTLTMVPTRTPTVTRTATATPAQATLTLQQGVSWYRRGKVAPYDGVADTYISAWNRNGNLADAATFGVRQGNIMAALIYLDLEDMPSTLPVQRAELALYVSARSNDTPMTVTLLALRQPWLLREATWLQSRQGLLWEAPGAGGAADRDEDPIAEVVASERAGWLTFDVTGPVRQWLADPQTNQGLLLTGAAANAVQYDFVSADSRDERHRPRLTLTFPTGALLLAPPNAPTATVTATPTVDPARPEAVNVARLLPYGSTWSARAVGDLGNRGLLDIVVAYSMPGERGMHIAVLTYPDVGRGPGDYRLLWNSIALAGSPPAALDVVDLSGDGTPEILLNITNPDGAGRRLYVLVRRPADYRLALAVGGYFDGKNYFGASGFDLAEAGSDGRVKIRAHYDGQVETYAWDGANFAVVQ